MIIRLGQSNFSVQRLDGRTGGGLGPAVQKSISGGLTRGASTYIGAGRHRSGGQYAALCHRVSHFS